MVVYADTSFLVSLYVRDANSEPAQKLASALDVPIALHPFLLHESRNAFRLAVFRKEMTSHQCRAVLSTMESDMRAGVLLRTPVPWNEIFEQAETISATHSSKLGTRAADILHVAAAAVLGVKVFYTFDVRQKALARKVGMKVRPV